VFEGRGLSVEGSVDEGGWSQCFQRVPPLEGGLNSWSRMMTAVRQASGHRRPAGE